MSLALLIEIVVQLFDGIVTLCRIDLAEAAFRLAKQ
jgi:hypothetical protein